jgi:hypothetical protein
MGCLRLNFLLPSVTDNGGSFFCILCTNYSMKIRQNSKSLLRMSIGTRIICLMKKTRVKKSCCTVSLNTWMLTLTLLDSVHPFISNLFDWASPLFNKIWIWTERISVQIIHIYICVCVCVYICTYGYIYLSIHILYMYACPFLPVLFWLSRSCCFILAIMSYLSWLSFLTVLSMLSCSKCPVLADLSWWTKFLFAMVPESSINSCTHGLFLTCEK